ncbi:MAG: hypothetical protein A2V52_04295 [Actinobacteria bacterium RBG_19FT_COMBO_54_7]|nr:MAG: hypothetical protein A2V52_04295 [Actinobacteria bacterium RBG_19FT_COMBO_54_7]
MLLRATLGNVMQFNDDEGTYHEIWRIEQPDEIEALKSILAAKTMIIADGHHRYETALAYSQESNPEGRLDSPANYVSAVIFCSQDPGLVILPVHRVLKRLPLPWPEVKAKLERFFELEEITEPVKGLEGMNRVAFVMVRSESALRLTLKPGIALRDIVEGPESERWKSLDISILHSLVFGQCMNLNADLLAEDGELYFTPWENSAFKDVEEGRAEACFLVRATRIEDIWGIAEGGERMPHKSSYFYPKLPSGLIIYDHRSAS